MKAYQDVADEFFKRLAYARKVATTDPLLSVVLTRSAWQMLRKDSLHRLKGARQK